MPRDHDLSCGVDGEGPAEILISSSRGVVVHDDAVKTEVGIEDADRFATPAAVTSHATRSAIFRPTAAQGHHPEGENKRQTD
jgi:hypothetical protein